MYVRTLKRTPRGILKRIVEPGEYVHRHMKYECTTHCNHFDIFNLIKQLMETQRTTNDKIDQLMSKIDRQGAESISLRNEVSAIKARVCGEAHNPKFALPLTPLATVEDFAVFEESLKEEKSFNNLVMEMLAKSEKTYDKFIKCCWRQLITDEVAKQCSWRGTEIKRCVRSLRTTLAIRNAFKQKFALEDSDFDRVTQKYFQYAQDKGARFEKSDSKKIKI